MSKPENDASLEMLQEIEAWEKDPQKMYDWRSKAMKVILQTLYSIVAAPVDTRSRSQPLAKVRAAEQLGRLFEKMGAMRMDVPVVCPNCGKEHVVP